jgi:hypothetical protein
VLQRAFTFHAAVAWGILGGDIADTWRRFNGAYFNDALNLSHSSSARHCPSANASGNARTIQVTTEAAEPSRPARPCIFWTTNEVDQPLDRRTSGNCGVRFLNWDPVSRAGSLAADWVPSWVVVAGFDSHEMAVIQGQNLVVVG